MAVGNAIAVLLVVLAPVGLIYAWVCYFTPADQEAIGWRSRATLLSLALASLAVLLWLEMMLQLPGADWRTLVTDSRTVDLQLPLLGMGSAEDLFNAALGLMYDGDLFHIEAVQTENFAGTTYFYVVTAVE